MRKGRVVALSALLLAVVVAGCGEKAKAVDDVVIVDSSQQTVEVESGGKTAKEPAGNAVLEGVVVDEAIRTVAGATVRLPGLEVQKKTDAQGRFSFAGLLGGPYLIEADAKGFERLEAVIDVPEGKTTQVRVELVALPSEDPYHRTQKFTGHGELVSTWTLGLTGQDCSPCRFQVRLEGVADTLVLEAVRPSGGSVESGFDLRIDNTRGNPVASASGGDPAYLRADGEALGGDTVYYVEARPTAILVPETSVDFEVFVTAFYNGEAPEAWSAVEGDP